MKDQKHTEDLTARYEQLRLRSKQRLIGGIIILLFALFLLLYVVAKIKPLSSHTTIIMKTKASDTEQLAIKQIVNNRNTTLKSDSSSNMIQVVDKNEASEVSKSKSEENKSEELDEKNKERKKEASKPKVAQINSEVIKEQNINNRVHKKNKIKTESKVDSKPLDPEAILNGHS
jgi:hypothetical protein